MRVLIIGGGGLLGTHLRPLLLDAGHTVAISDDLTGCIKHRLPEDCKLLVADSEHYSTMRYVFDSFKPEAVLLAATRYFAESTTYNLRADAATLINSANILASLLSPQVKWVGICSGSAAYGVPDPRAPLKETRKIITPASYRGAAELAAERLLSFRCYELDIPLTTARIFDMYGPRVFFSAHTGVFSFLIDSFLRQEPIGIRGLRKQRDFVHVEDVASALLALFEESYQGTVNIGTGKGTTLEELYLLLSKEIDIVNPPMAIPDRALPSLSAVANTAVLSSIMKEHGGWSPRKLTAKEVRTMVSFRREEKSMESNAAAILAAQRGLR